MPFAKQAALIEPIEVPAKNSVRSRSAQLDANHELSGQHPADATAIEGENTHVCS